MKITLLLILLFTKMQFPPEVVFSLQVCHTGHGFPLVMCHHTARQSWARRLHPHLWHCSTPGELPGARCRPGQCERSQPCSLGACTPHRIARRGLGRHKGNGEETLHGPVYFSDASVASTSTDCQCWLPSFTYNLEFPPSLKLASRYLMESHPPFTLTVTLLTS